MAHGFRYYIRLETNKPLDGKAFHDKMKKVIQEAIGSELRKLDIGEEPEIREGHYEIVDETTA